MSSLKNQTELQYTISLPLNQQIHMQRVNNSLKTLFTVDEKR